MEKKLKLREFKDNKSTWTDDIRNNLHVHNLTIVIYIQYKFHHLPSIGYLIMAEDRRMDRHTEKLEGWTNNLLLRLTNIPLPFMD